MTIERLGRAIEEGDLEETEEAAAAKPVIALRTEDIDSITGIGAIVPFPGGLVGAVVDTAGRGYRRNE